MHRRIIAGIIAASVVLTTVGALPARAGEKDVARIATLLGVAVVGKLIYDKYQREKEQAAQQQQVSRSQPYSPVYVPQQRQQPQYRAPELHVHPHQPAPRVEAQPRVHRDHPAPRTESQRAPAPVAPRPLPELVDRKLLPKECFRSYDTVSGSHLMFGEDCLRDNYRFANRLPQECAQRVQTYSGIRNGYDARCLRQSGYSLARG